MVVTSEDEKHMRSALAEAKAAAAVGEVPVGAVLVVDGVEVARGRNRTIERGTPLAHAEMEALAAAFARVDGIRVPGSVLYCTLEPCFMCAGALLHARVARVVFGARDPKFGACGSLAELPADRRLNHRFPVEEGLLADESAALLRAFFRRLR